MLRGWTLSRGCHEYLRTSFGAALMSAAGSVGALIGPIFGIPRAVQEPESRGAETLAKPWYLDNANSEKVFDRLTKMIAGVSNIYPPCSAMVGRRIALWRANADRIVSRANSHNPVEPSMSVNKNVTIPDGTPTARRSG
jgi:hypothetical protein